MTPQSDIDIENLEIRLLLDGIYETYGYDFREYAPTSLKRRIKKSLHEEHLKTVSELQNKILHDVKAMERFLYNISIDVTAMFRDPAFYRAYRIKVLPALRKLPFFRVWHCGCATGEEVYSNLILLHEEGLNGNVRIYATDMNYLTIEKAKQGTYPLSSMHEYTENYLKSGGTRDFSEYYTAKYDNAILNSSFRDKIVWASHNVVSDASFNEFHIIFCRNVLIYFSAGLQEKVHKLLYESLATGGFLCLGSKESLTFTPFETSYEIIDEKEKIYRKMR